MVEITLGAVNPVAGSSKSNKTGAWRTMKPVLDVTKCNKCYLCYMYCPDSAVIKLEDTVEIDYDYCKGCGICAYECKSKAIEMVFEEK
jgi:pyruvate ferredoxin oxidoreductase delta subunit